MSFEEYLKTYGTEYIEAICYKFYIYYNIKNIKAYDFNDFVQDCTIHLFTQWSQWKEEKASINTFIYLIIKCYSYKILRKSNAQKRVGSKNEYSLDYEIEGNSNKKMKVSNNYSELSCNLYNSDDEYKHLVEYCCSQIKNDKHKLLFKMYLNGYSYEEIGKIINMKTINVNSTCQRIRRKFKEGYYRII